MVRSKETCPAVLNMKTILRKLARNNPYQSIAEFMTDKGVKEIAHSRTGEKVLAWAGHKLNQSSFYIFRERILRNRHEFSDDFIVSVWNELFTDDINRHHQRIVEADGSVNEFYRKVVDIEQLRQSVVSSSLLIDSPVACHRYCQAQKPGWETLRYVGVGRMWHCLPEALTLQRSMDDDDYPSFELNRQMLHVHVSFSMIADLLRCGSLRIFRALLDNQLDEIESVVPLEELACYITAQFPESEAVSMLTILEEVKPGLISHFSDALGQNLLWYEMHNSHFLWFHPNCALTPFLLEHGCCPEQPMHLGLSWQRLTDGLSNERKSSLWHSWHRRIAYNPQMTEAQPNLWGAQPNFWHS